MIERAFPTFAFGGFVYFAFRATGALCICPHLSVGMAVCSGIAVIFGPLLLRAFGFVLFVLSIVAAVHDFKAQAIEDAKIATHQQVALRQHLKSNVK